MSVTTNVTAGKPKIGGAIFRAPLGTALPTDATTDLPAIWKEIGYCSDEGVTNSNTRSSEEIRAWGGDVVLNVQSEKTDTFQMTWIETLNPDTLKAVHGDDNVSGDLKTGISIKVNGKELPAASYVIDMQLRDEAIKRIVIPNAKITEVDDTTYADEEVVGYPVTLGCMPDEEGNTHYEYIIRATDDGGDDDDTDVIKAPTLVAEAASTVLFGTPVSDIQDNVVIADGKITGTLKNLTSGDIVDAWGAGHFIALKFDDIDASATSVLVGMDPSEGSGLVEIIDDPDKNGVFKVTNKDTQVFKVVITDGTNTTTKTYDLTGLVFEA